MRPHVTLRKFTMCKAALLAGLIVLSQLMGPLPGAAGAQLVEAGVGAGKDCEALLLRS